MLEVNKMKKFKAISLLLAFICIMALTVPVFAANTRASDQIRAYRMDTIVTEGAINIEFSITGKVIMKKIGCESIYIYKKVGTTWIYDDDKTEDDPGMSVTKKGHLGNTITFDGIAGVEYMVVVTVFAEDDSAHDTRSRTLYVTGK